MSTKDLFDLTGKVALITGGGRGLGLIMGHALAECGAEIVIFDKNPSTDAAKEITAATGKKAIGIECDITKEEEVVPCVAQAIKEMGKIDILVNNAGRAWMAKPEELPIADWRKVMDLNINAMFLMCQTVGKHMIERNEGRIINVASVAGFVGGPPEHNQNIVYNASKGAVVNFTRDLACKWAQHNINVVGIAPGWFVSDLNRNLLESEHGQELLKLIPMRRYGEENDLKGAIAFLASPAASFVTGHTLPVEGGRLCI